MPLLGRYSNLVKYKWLRARFARFWILALLVLLSGCTVLHTGASRFIVDGAPQRDVDVSAIPDAIPRIENITRAGNGSPYTVLGKTYHVNFNAQGFAQSGYASWYGTKFHGNSTANGDVYDMYAMTAAHKTLPIPSYVKVTNLENQRSIIVRVNDRGPFHDGRVIDLSYVAAKKLGMLQKGTAKVLLEVVVPSGGEPESAKEISQLTQKQLYLQVGAFSHMSSAESLKRQLLGMTAHHVQVDQEQQKAFYRVLVGPLQHDGELTALRQTLKRVNIDQTIVVQR